MVAQSGRTVSFRLMGSHCVKFGFPGGDYALVVVLGSSVDLAVLPAKPGVIVLVAQVLVDVAAVPGTAEVIQRTDVEVLRVVCAMVRGIVVTAPHTAAIAL